LFDVLCGLGGCVFGAVVSYVIFFKKIHEKDMRISYLSSLLDQEKQNVQFLAKTQEEMKNSFQGLSSQIFQNQNQHFLSIAKTTFEQYFESAKSEFSHKHKSIDELLIPIKESLAHVDTKMQDLEKEREGSYHALRQQVGDLIQTQKDLRQETSTLSHALRTPSARGKWGEVQLRRVVELAGMIKHCDFTEQKTFDPSHDKRLRPDMVVHLPGSRQIVLDAKVPLTSYLSALETTSEEIRADLLKDHAKKIRSHIQILASKGYQEGFGLDLSPDFVVLFLPGEVFFSAALEFDPMLIEFGIENKVILATPTTLIALLRSVAYGWRQEKYSQNAAQISKMGQELYRRLLEMSESFGKLGKHISNTVQNYNQVVGTFEGKVLNQARKFEEFSDTQDEIHPISPVEHSVRPCGLVEEVKKVG
jgi:DNA recombination protein RmuC